MKTLTAQHKTKLRRAAKNKRSVHQIDPKTSQVVATFVSCAEAARYVGTSQGNISRALKGELTVVKGFKWRDANPQYEQFRAPSQETKQKTREALKNFYKNNPSSIPRKKIYQISKTTGETIKIFSCAQEAGEAFGLSRSTIRNYVFGKAHFDGDYIFKNEDQITLTQEQKELTHAT